MDDDDDTAAPPQPTKPGVDAARGLSCFGLEIDPRCPQIAAFNLALTAAGIENSATPTPGP